MHRHERFFKRYGKIKLIGSAGLNCGQCITKHGNKCAEGPHCQHFFLHKFRHTFATEHLRQGIDIRTLQTWMGHRDIKSTMVYLKRSAVEKVGLSALTLLSVQDILREDEEGV